MYNAIDAVIVYTSAHVCEQCDYDSFQGISELPMRSYPGKYKTGNRLTSTVGLLEKKMKINEGEVPQYYVRNSHPAIIEPLAFDQVQQEIACRKVLDSSYSDASIFANRIYCGECGGLYGGTVWDSTSKYKHTVWRSNQKYENEARCSTLHVTKDEAKAASVTVMNECVLVLMKSIKPFSIVGSHYVEIAPDKFRKL